MTFLKQFVNEEQGQDMVEYGLVMALIGLVVIAAVTTLGTNLSTGFASMGTKVSTNIK